MYKNNHIQKNKKPVVNQKNYIKELIKEMARTSKIVIELRKGKFIANDKAKILNNYHFKDSQKDFLLIRSSIFSPAIKECLKKLSFFRHRFEPEQEKYTFQKNLINMKKFFKEEEISFTEIPEIKVDFLFNNKTYVFDLTNQVFFIKKEYKKENINILYRNNQFRLMLSKEEKQDVIKDPLDFLKKDLSNVEFIRIKFKNDFLMDFMKFSFFKIFSESDVKNVEIIFDYCQNVMSGEIKENIFESFWKLLEKDLKSDLSFQIECQLNYDFLLNCIKQGEKSYNNLFETFLENFLELYQDIPQFEVLKNNDQNDLVYLQRDFEDFGF